MTPRYRCDHCGAAQDGAPPLWRCDCGGPVHVDSTTPFEPRGGPPDMRRYAACCDLPDDIPEATGIGFSPIVEVSIDGEAWLLKLESLMPTGSFKDRGAASVIARMRMEGRTRAVEDSSGNAGLALAAGAARAGIEMEVVVPDDAPPVKIAAIEVCGGRVVRVPGGREAATREALRRAATGTPFASHSWNPWFIQGTMSFAFELWDQTAGQIPDPIVIPVGNGTLYLGAARGFDRIRASRRIARAPRIIGVQAEACAPLAGGRATDGATCADGIRVARPARAATLRRAAQACGGEFMAVSDDAIRVAREALGLAGIDAEPTAAVGLAGAMALRRRSGSFPGLVVVTGTGLKAAA